MIAGTVGAPKLGKLPVSRQIILGLVLLFGLAALILLQVNGR
nr:hypothetical protein [Lacticaseibacillus manihotivorans]